MLFAPDLDVALDVDRLTLRPGLRVKVSDLPARGRTVHRAILTAEGDSVDVLERLHSPARPGPHRIERWQ